MTAAPQPSAADDPVAAVMAVMGDAVLNRLNVDFEDSMVFVGRVLGGYERATATRATAVDQYGVDAVVTDPDGEHVTRIEFAAPVQDVSKLTDALLGLVARAREESGEEGQTTAEREVAELARIRTFLTTVVAVEEVNEHLRRVTVAGRDLATFAPTGPDCFVYVLVPPPGCAELAVDHGFTWEAHAAMPDDVRPVGAYYTVRRWRPEVQEIDLLMVLHGDAGPASAWAQRAAVGDPVALWGPRTSFHPPPSTQSLLLVADETGLPAAAVILEQLPDGWTAQVVAEVGSEAERQPLRASPAIDVKRIHRDGAAPGDMANDVAQAVRSLPTLGPNPYVWGGGESHTMTRVRRHVRDQRGLPREAVSLVAYWHRRKDA